MAVSNEVIKEHKLYINIKANLEEACDHIHGLESDCQELASENRYLYDFLQHKDLMEEFQYFKDHAHPDNDEELPFPDYVL